MVGKKKKASPIGNAKNFFRSRIATTHLRHTFGKNIKQIPSKRRITLRIVPDGPLHAELAKYKKRNPEKIRENKSIQMVLGMKPVFSGKTPKSHARAAVTLLEGIAKITGVPVISIEHRLKKTESLRRKLLTDQTFHKMLSTKNKEQREKLQQQLQREWIGIRVVVPTEHDIRKMSNMIRQIQTEYGEKSNGPTIKLGLSEVRDYVSNPRKDGLILGEDPKDEYRGLHIFTHGLTGAPMEIQIWTADMEKNVKYLAEKYGKTHSTTYWKNPEFRRRKKALGDNRGA